MYFKFFTSSVHRQADDIKQLISHPSIIAASLLTIINFSTIDSVKADTDLYRCKSANTTSYQDQPCAHGTAKNTTNRRENPLSLHQQQVISLSTRNTGVTNGGAAAGNSSNLSAGRYFSSPIDQPNSFQDSYIPIEINIDQIRLENKLANQKMRCESIHKELWRLQYSQASASQTKIGGDDQEHPWVVHRRSTLQKYIEKNCSS